MESTIESVWEIIQDLLMFRGSAIIDGVGGFVHHRFIHVYNTASNQNSITFKCAGPEKAVKNLQALKLLAIQISKTCYLTQRQPRERPRAHRGGDKAALLSSHSLKALPVQVRSPTESAPPLSPSGDVARAC